MFIKMGRIKKLICLSLCVGCINSVPLYLYASTTTDNSDIISALASYPAFNLIRNSIESQGVILNPVVNRSSTDADTYGFELEGNENNKLNFPTILRKKIEDARYFLLCAVTKADNIENNKLLPLFMSVVKYKKMDLPVVMLTDGHESLIIDFNNEKMFINKKRSNKFLNNKYNSSSSYSLVKCLWKTLGITSFDDVVSFASVFCSFHRDVSDFQTIYFLACEALSCMGVSVGCPVAIANFTEYLGCEAVSVANCMEGK